MCFYRPQRSCGQGNIFTPVCHSFCSQGGKGVCLSACWDTPPIRYHLPPRSDTTPHLGPGRHHPKPGRQPPDQTPPPTPPPNQADILPDQADPPIRHHHHPQPPQTRQTPQIRHHHPSPPGRPPKPGRTPPPRKQTPAYGL